MKQLSTIAFILFFIANNLIAQNQEVSTSINEGEKPVRFGIHVNAKKTFQQKSHIEHIVTQGGYSFSIGGDIYYKLSNRFELKSGLSLHRISLIQKDYSYLVACDFISTEFDTLGTYLIQNNAPYYFGIPLETKIKLVGQENHLYLKAGLEVLFNLNYTTKHILVQCRNERLKVTADLPVDFSNTIFRFKSGIGYETAFIKESRLFFEPQFEYTFNQVAEQVVANSSETNKTKIFDIGIILGIIF